MAPPTATGNTTSNHQRPDQDSPHNNSSATDTAATRPHLPHRQSSQSSHVSLSLSEASSTPSGNTSHPRHHHHPHQHKAQRHHGRLGPRNTSFGHNLNKLAQQHHGAASSSKMPHDGNHHTTSQPGTPTTITFSSTDIRPSHVRSKSGDSGELGESAATSPRPSHHMKRNASAFVVPRNHSHSALKKNYSSGHLPRNLSGKALNKTVQHRAPQPKRKHSGRSEKSAPASPVSPQAPLQPTVRFALADDQGPDSDEDEESEWTEESASVSPNVTRNNTQHSSVVLDPSTMAAKEADHSAHDATSGEESTHTVIHEPGGAGGERRLDEARKQDAAAAKQINGESSYLASARTPALDADAITSRLLQRKAPPTNGTEPQVTSVSALVQPDPQDNRSLSCSQASTIAEGTPGRDLVSRFVNANSTDGTPRDGNLLPRKSSPPKESGDLDVSKRNKSVPNMADRGPLSPAHARSASRRSGTSTPTDLPPSRTQQKLLLQRASSALEPAKHIPAVLPRPGAAQLLGHGLSFTSAEGDTPAQLQALFTQINKEYNVTRRYRNPVADAAARAREIPRPPERRTLASSDSRAQQKQKRRADQNGTSMDGHVGPEESFRGQQRHEQGGGGRQARQHEHERADRRQVALKEEQRGHKSRVSFDLPSVRTEDSDDDVGGPPSRVGGMRRDEAYEICRRMWDMGEPESVVG